MKDSDDFRFWVILLLLLIVGIQIAFLFAWRNAHDHDRVVEHNVHQICQKVQAGYCAELR